MDHPVDVGETIPKGWSIKRAVEEFRLPDNAIAINEALRAGTPLTDIEDEYGGDEEDDATYYQDIHDVLLYAARYSKLRQEVTVHRGTVEVPGQVATETPCWWSTSLNKDVAERFATESQPFFTPVDGARATIITLELPPGTHVINTLKEDVEEMILPPGTSWEPLSVEDDGMVRRIHGVVTDWMK